MIAGDDCMDCMDSWLEWEGSLRLAEPFAWATFDIHQTTTFNDRLLGKTFWCVLSFTFSCLHLFADASPPSPADPFARSVSVRDLE